MFTYVSPGLLIINFFFLIRYYRKLKTNKTILDEYEKNKEKLSTYMRKTHELKNKNFDMTYILNELRNENNNLKNEVYSKEQKIYELIDENKDLKDKKHYKNEEKELTPFVEKDFGEGLIRINDNGVYYHGVCEKEKQKWNKDNQCCKQIFEYKFRDKNKHNLDKYNTFNIDIFCNNCLMIADNYKYKTFECQGHQY